MHPHSVRVSALFPAYRLQIVDKSSNSGQSVHFRQFYRFSFSPPGVRPAVAPPARGPAPSPPPGRSRMGTGLRPSPGRTSWITSLMGSLCLWIDVSPALKWCAMVRYDWPGSSSDTSILVRFLWVQIVHFCGMTFSTRIVEPSAAHCSTTAWQWRFPYRLLYVD